MHRVTMIVANIFATLLLLATAANALVIDRQSANGQLYNTTVTCGQAFFGGCCTAPLDMYGNNPSCKCWCSCATIRAGKTEGNLGYNATLAAYNVGGSTMGIQSEYACLNRKTSDKSAFYYALCCKYMQFNVRELVFG